MAKRSNSSRPEFRRWVDEQSPPEWQGLPLFHTTKGLLAGDIIREKQLSPEYCKVLKAHFAFLFYGRPAYRISGDGPLKKEAACPFCFVFRPELLGRAREIFAFDTGAFGSRMFKHALMNEMQIQDFSLDSGAGRADKLISKAFGSIEKYFDSIPDVAALRRTVKGWDFLVSSYIDLISSSGRNEPDDRVATIEAVFSEPVRLEDNLLAIIVPHTVWSDEGKAPWLVEWADRGVSIATYVYNPGRGPEYYQALLEAQARAIVLGR